MIEGSSPVQLLSIFTINEELRNREDLLEIIWKAFDYFPKGVWEGINYLGNVKAKCDLKIKFGDKVYEAFVFNNLMAKIRKIKKALKTCDLLLVLTHDPVIAIYHRLELGRLARTINVIRDFVSKDVGVVSLFELNEKVSIKVTAHGLGHNQGLEHHVEPVDLMYVSLLDGCPIRRDGFCNRCQRKLIDSMSSNVMINEANHYLPA